MRPGFLKSMSVSRNSIHLAASWTDRCDGWKREPSVRSIEDLIHFVVAQFPHESSRPDAIHQLDAFQTATGFALPPDLRAFYTRIRRADIRGQYLLLPVEEFQRTGAALQGDEWADSEPPSWYTFCDVLDGNFLGIDLAPGQHRVLDCDHEDILSRRVIASSFADFLDRALAFDDGLYYLQIGEVPTIKVPYRPPVEWLRREYLKWSLDPEVGPRVCTADGCGRLCVSLTVHCRRHHFEAIHRLPYPFDD